MSLLTGRASALMSPFVSFPAVLGHEVVGAVVDAGPAVDTSSVGDRVVVDPVISCLMRGLTPCRECEAGHPATCLRATDGSISPGLLIGYCRDLPGGWGDEMLVHRSQVYRVPDELSDEEAVLVEPLSVALHAVIARPPTEGERVMVIGAGVLGLLLLAALRGRGANADVTCLARHRMQADWAGRLGAARVVSDEVDAAIAAGASMHRSLAGRPIYAGGFDVVYDCVGSRESVDLALRLAGPHGRVVNVGGPGILSPLDLTPSWVRELEITGSYVYGREPSLDGAPHTFELALRLLSDHPELNLGALVTHRFALEDWQRAMATILRRGRSGALKVVFDIESAGRG